MVETLEESRLDNIISKIEETLWKMEAVETRMIKADELVERAKKDNNDPLRYDLAKREYQNQIKRIITDVACYVRNLDQASKKFVEDTAKIESERLRNQGMYEVELELAE